MMTTERMLQFCVSMMAALATLMLGTSQDSSLLPIIGLLVALVSLCFHRLLGLVSPCIRSSLARRESLQAATHSCNRRLPDWNRSSLVSRIY